MNSNQSSIETKIVKLIQKAGGKLTLSDLKHHYEKEYKCSFPLPLYVKLSEWVRRFESIKLERNHKNNQMYMLEKKKKHVVNMSSSSSCSEMEKNGRTNDIENKIALLLKENDNRIELGHFASAYKKKFNEDLLTPVGMKLRKWVEQFPSVIVEHNAQTHQTYLVRHVPVMMGSVMNEEQSILSLLRDNDGCIGHSAFARLYREKYSQDLLLPVGMKLSHWLCTTFNTIALIQKPSNNEIYICLKHPVQIAIDESSSKMNPTSKDGTCIMIMIIITIYNKKDSNIDYYYANTNYTSSIMNGISVEHQEEKKKDVPNPEIRFEKEHAEGDNVTNIATTSEREVANSPTNKPSAKLAASSMSSNTTTYPDDNNNSSSSFVRSNIQDEDELSKLINEAVEKVVGRIASSSRMNQQNDTVNKDTKEDGQNHHENNKEELQPLTESSPPQFVHEKSGEWSMMEEDQKEIMIAEAMNLLGLSLSNANKSS